MHTGKDPVLDKLSLHSPRLVVAPRPSPASELSFRELGMMLWRRQRLIYTTILVFILLALVAVAFSTRRYRATGEIEVQKDSVSSLNLQSGNESPSDALETNMMLQTQAKILESDSLALHVIKELNLESTSDYKEKWNPIGWVFGLLSPAGKSDPKGASLEDSPHRRMTVLRIFHSKLTVKPVPGTRLIDVQYLSPDPQLAAAVVNHLLQGLIESSYQSRYDATMQASSWLNNQLGDLRQQTEALQNKLVKLRQETGVFALGEVDRQGKDQVYSPTLDRLQMVTQALAQAQSNRILKGAIYNVVKSGDPEQISNLSGNVVASSSTVASSLTLIQNLRLQESTLLGQLQEMKAKFGPGYPKVNELQGNLDGVQQAIKAEVTRVAGRAHNDYIVAAETEQKTLDDFHTEESNAEALNDKTIQYQLVRQEADQTRSLYEDLLRRLKESGLVAGLRSTNISIVDPGRPSDKPAKPMVLLYLAGSIVAGAIVGIAAALLRDVTDTKIQGVREISREVGATPLCVLPFEKQVPVLSSMSTSPLAGLPALGNSRSLYVESLRSLRTSLLLSRSGNPPKTVLVTSSVAGEGKSFISWNLAILFAQQGKRVLLCDADLRNPRLHRDLGMENVEAGLSTALAGLSNDGDGGVYIVAAPGVNGLDVLPAGPLPPYPAELLSSDRMTDLLDQWQQYYDVILLDAPPVLPVTDSVILSTMVDSVLLVAWYQKTLLSALERSYQMLADVQTDQNHKVNIVLNGVKQAPSSGHTFYQYAPKISRA